MASYSLKLILLNGVNFIKLFPKLMLLITITPTYISAQELDFGFGYGQTSGTITDGRDTIDLTSSGYTLSSSLDVSENAFLSLAFSTSSGSVTFGGASVDVETSATSFGIGLYSSNDLDKQAGTGSSSGYGIAVSSAEVTAGTLTQKVNIEEFVYSAAFAASPGISASFTFSTPFDSFFTDYTGGIGLEYSITDGTSASFSYNSTKAIADGLETNSSGFFIGVNFTN